MPALALNGITIPLTEWEELESNRLGARSRGTSGRLEASDRRIRRKRRWRGVTQVLPREEATAWRGLIGGLGDHWTFDSNANSVRGRVPASSNLLVVPAGPGSLANHSYYANFGGTDFPYLGRATWIVPPVPEWTLIFSAYRPGPGWRRWVKRNDGAQWYATSSSSWVRNDAADLRILGLDADGTLWFQAAAYGGAAWVANKSYAVGDRTVGSTWAHEVITAGTSGGAAPTWATTYEGQTTDNTVVWKAVGDSGGNGHVGDLAWLPYKVPDSWAAQIRDEHLARAWTSPPKIRATGTLMPAEPTIVLGSIVGSTPTAANFKGVLDRGAESLEFELEEVY